MIKKSELKELEFEEVLACVVLAYQDVFEAWDVFKTFYGNEIHNLKPEVIENSLRQLVKATQKAHKHDYMLREYNCNRFDDKYN